MAVLLEIRNASKRYGEQVLLDDASATITDDGKVGFVGRNGAGKSVFPNLGMCSDIVNFGAKKSPPLPPSVRPYHYYLCPFFEGRSSP